MAEPFQIQKQPTSFMDILRTLALIGGAGLSAHPQGRPVGAALTAGGLLIGQGQDRTRERALSSALAAVSRGDSDLPSVQQALAERGYYTPDAEQELRKADLQRQISPIQSDLFRQLTASSEERELEPQRVLPNSPPAAGAFLEPANEPADIATNLSRLAQRPGGIAQLAIVSPQAADALLSQQRFEQSAAQHMETEARLRRNAQLEQEKYNRKMATQEATGQYLSTALDPATPKEQLREATINAARAGVESSVFNRYGDPASDINLDVRTYLSKMGKNPHTATAGDIESAHRQVLYDQAKQQQRIKTALIEAQTAAAWDIPFTPEQQKYFIDPATLKRAPTGITPRQARDQGFVAMDPVSQRSIRGTDKASGLLQRLETLALGGPVSDQDAKYLGIKPGTVLPPIFEGKEGEGVVQSLIGRMKATGHIRLDMLEQNMRGIRANLYEQIKKQYLAVFSRGPGEERGATTEFDVVRAEKGFAIAKPDNLLGLSDTLEMSRALFDEQRSILKDIRERAFGLNGLTDINGMQPPPPPLIPATPGTSGETQSGTPAPVSPGDIDNALNNLQKLLQPGAR